MKARDLEVGDRIMWAGHRCTVTRVEREPRQRYGHRIWMLVDLTVPGLPRRTNLRYSPDEPVQTWELPPFGDCNYARIIEREAPQ